VHCTCRHLHNTCHAPAAAACYTARLPDHAPARLSLLHCTLPCSATRCHLQHIPRHLPFLLPPVAWVPCLPPACGHRNTTTATFSLLWADPICSTFHLDLRGGGYIPFLTYRPTTVPLPPGRRLIDPDGEMTLPHTTCDFTHDLFHGGGCRQAGPSMFWEEEEAVISHSGAGRSPRMQEGDYTFGGLTIGLDDLQ